VIGECLPRHRAKEFIRFLEKIDRVVAKSFDLHLIVDNYTTHKTKAVRAWLAKHPRFKLHFTTDFLVLDQPCRTLLRGDNPQTHSEWRLQER
jgi:hypothetical protein